jgi:hypothetical protein
MRTPHQQRCARKHLILGWFCEVWRGVAVVEQAEDEGTRLSTTVVLYILLYIRHLQTSLQDSLLYIISLQQRSLNLVLYTLNPILETYFVPNFCTYIFIIPQMWQYQPELYRLKYASPLQRALTYFKRYNPLACRVTSR